LVTLTFEGYRLLRFHSLIPEGQYRQEDGKDKALTMPAFVAMMLAGYAGDFAAIIVRAHVAAFLDIDDYGPHGTVDPL
jgi:hypothetical protein